MQENRICPGADVEAVITSYNQGDMILEALQSVCVQTVLPQQIIIVDDGSSDEHSMDILNRIEKNMDFPVPVRIHYQKNSGVSAARNAGIRQTGSALVLVLDGDDTLEPTYIEEVSGLLLESPQMVAASSGMWAFGILNAVIRPTGGDIIPFLSHNCCPATHILRKKAYMACAGYDETMRLGFEDWDFFLSLLENAPQAQIGIVGEPLINYRTSPVSTNVKSMNQRLNLMRYIIEKHKSSYLDHLTEVLLDLEAISDSRLYGWENEIVHVLQTHQELGDASKSFLDAPSYGDGGMAAAVRIASIGVSI